MKNMKPAALQFGLDDRPPLANSLVAALQHLLAIFAAIITAPLIISHAIGLNTQDTNFLISSSLFVSGIATLIQVVRLGPLGSGLLCIQGTSFSFMGPVIMLWQAQHNVYSPEQFLAVILGSCLACAAVVVVLGRYIHLLQKVISSAVTGTAIVLLGGTLVIKTLQNIYYAASNASSPWVVYIMAIAVAALISLFASREQVWLRITSISAGMLSVYIISALGGQIDFAPLADIPAYFVPEIGRFGFAFDSVVFWSLLPIFLVIAMESVGDLTTTSRLSKQAISGPLYWCRIRGGVMADAFNSGLAAVFSTFPNTTFSQNNGVIQLTGVTSRYVGLLIGLMLLILGLFPIVGGLFQVMPKGLLHGATVIMFALVTRAGFDILTSQTNNKQALSIAFASIFIACVLAFVPNYLNMPTAVSMILGFPVATGTICAVFIQICLLLVPRQT